MIQQQTSIGWYAVNSILRTDFVKKIKNTDLHYNHRNLGLGLMKKSEKIVNTEDKPWRIIPYLRPFQTAITFEIDSTKYEMTRVEFTFFNWLATVGGLSSIALAITNAAGAFDNAQMYVTSALIRPSPDKSSSSSSFSPDEVQDKCCVTVRSKLAVRLPKLCKIGGSKGRILG